MRARFATLAFVAVGAAVLGPFAPRVARAQASNRNPAVAQALYDEARQLVQAGKFAEACPKFKESYELDPGGGTLLNLADCYEKQGKTALAWTTFKEALVAAQRDGRRDRTEFANKHLAGLENRLARLTVQVPAGARVAGLSLSLDGSPLGDAAWGVAIPVDPGPHTVRAEAPGKQPFETAVEVSPASGARVSLDVPSLADAPVASAPAASATPLTSSTTPVPRVDGGGGEVNQGSSSRATAGWIVGGVGVASIGVASYFGLRAFSQWSVRESYCPQGLCKADAVTPGKNANTAATISDVGFGVGLAAVAVGTYLVLSGHKKAPAASQATAVWHATPGALPHGAGLWIGGGW